MFKQTPAPLSDQFYPPHLSLYNVLKVIPESHITNRQSDAFEIFCFLMHVWENRAKLIQRIVPLFERVDVARSFRIMEKSVVHCLQCNKEVVTLIEDKFGLLLNPTESGSDFASVNQLVERYSDTEAMVGNNRYACGECKSKQDALKTLTVVSSGNHVIIFLNRFVAGSVVKNTTPVNFGEPLTLPDGNYQVISVMVHLGTSINSGHYVCFVRHRQESGSFEWYSTNDLNVKGPLSPTDEVFTLENAKNVYMLMYTQI